MKTLPTNVSDNYLLTGNRPRTFVRISDSSGNDIGTWATSGDVTDYTDRLFKGQSINESITEFGGMTITSGAEISVLKLGEEIKFYSESTIYPIYQAGGTEIVAGRLLKAGSDYDTVRGSTVGDTQAYNNIIIGQQISPGTGNSIIYRGYMEFAIPSGITTCEDAYINLTVVDDETTQDFEIYVVEGEWDTGSVWEGTFGGNAIGSKSFDGWVAGTGDYTGTLLTETFDTSVDLSTTSTNRLRLNKIGRDLIVTNTGSNIKLMLLSSRDYDYDASNQPTLGTNEFVRFQVSDESTPSLELIYNTVKPDNQRTRIYLGFDDKSTGVPSAVSSMLNVWTGVVDRWSLNEKILSLVLRHDDYKRNVIVPQKIITTDNFPNCPQENIGRPYPVVYGTIFQDVKRHKTGIGSEFSGSSVDPLSGTRDYAPSPVVKYGDQDYNSPMEILVASGTNIKGTLQGFPALWNSSVEAFTRFYVLIASDKTGADYTYAEAVPKTALIANESTGDPTAVSRDHFSEALSVIPSGVYDTLDAVNPANCIDETVDSPTQFDAGSEYVEYGFNNVNSSGKINKVEITFYLDDDVDNGTRTMTIYVKEKATNALEENKTDGISSSVDATTSQFSSSSTNFTTKISVGDMLIVETGDNLGRFRVKDVGNPTDNDLRVEKMSDETETGQSFRVLNEGAILRTDTLIWGTGTRVINITNLNSSAMDFDLHNKLIRFIPTNESTPYDFNVYNLQVRYFIEIDRDRVNLVYFDKRGVKDGSDNVIEIPSKIIKSLAETEGGLTDGTDINTTDFTTADTALTNWTFAFQLFEKRKNLFNFAGTKGVMDGLAKQCKSIVRWDSQGKLTIKVMNDTDAFPVSGTNKPADLDIFEYSGSPSSNSFTKHPILSGSFKFTRINIDDTYNDFVLNYRYNYATKEYQENLYMDNGAGVAASVNHNLTSGDFESSSSLSDLKNFISTSFNEILTTNTLVFKAWAIRDEATANKLMQAFVEWYTRRRWVVQFKTSINAVGLDIGDFINIRNDDIEDQFGTATMEYKKWRIQKITTDLSSYTIKIKAIEAEIY